MLFMHACFLAVLFLHQKKRGGKSQGKIRNGTSALEDLFLIYGLGVSNSYVAPKHLWFKNMLPIVNNF